MEVLEASEARVGRLTVRRALPKRTHRTVGAWCFCDHMGPAAVTPDAGIDIGPHPHIGLHTVTWLVAGEVLHRDTLGSEQVIRPGQLNLMTAGRGVAHSEEATGAYTGALHGAQLWVAQPSATRNGDPGFEHHAELPQADIGTAAHATVLVGSFAGAESPARRDWDTFAAQVAFPELEAVTVPTNPEHEHAIVVLDGAVELEGERLVPGRSAYLAPGRSELGIAAGAAARVLVLGGVPFPETIRMWWNFVARTEDEIAAARKSWNEPDGRFGEVRSPLARIPAPS